MSLETNMFANPKLKIYLLLLPLCYFVYSLLQLYETYPMFTTMVDPYYAYLMNGTNLAGGHLEIGHLDHPGTPVQCFAALVIFIKHLFSGRGIPLYQDVLLHPESYLLACNFSVLTLFIVANYFTGIYIYRHTPKWATALLFQATPLLLQGVLVRTTKLAPEAFLIIFGTLFMAYFYVQFILPNDSEKKSNKPLIISGMFIGFLIACKFTAAVIILLPLFIVKGIKKKIFFIITALIAFVVFIIPALPKINYMFHWVTSLATHEGKYGQGSEGFANSVRFDKNLLLLFTTDVAFTSIYILISIALVATFIKKFKKHSSKVKILAIQSAWIYITLLVILVSKHYNFYYLFPTVLIFPVALIIIYESYIPWIENIFFLNKKTVSAAFLSILCVVQMKWYKDNTSLKRQSFHAMQDVHKYMEKEKNIPVIINGEYYSSFEEPALYFGAVYSGSMRNTYFSFLKKIYPNSYLYNTDIGGIVNWDLSEMIIPPLIFAKHSNTLVYFRDCDSADCLQQLNSIVNWNGITLAKYKKVYNNSFLNEQLYQISANTALSERLLNNYFVISCDLEKITPDKSGFIADDGHTVFQKANMITMAEHHSGQNSILLDKNNIYGLDGELPVKQGDYIKVTIWRKSIDNSAVIVLANSTNSFYKSGSTSVEKGENGWEKIECACNIPENYSEKKLHFYLYNPNKETVYFDDLDIAIYPMSLQK